MTRHPIFRDMSRATASIALGLTLLGCCCPVSDVTLEKPCAKPRPQVVKEAAEPIAISWDPSDKASSAFSSRNDVLELMFNTLEMVLPAPAPAGGAAAPTNTDHATGTIIISVPEGIQSEDFFVQIRGSLQRPKTGTVGLSATVGNAKTLFNISAGQVSPPDASVGYWIAAPFNAAGDPKPVDFELSFEAKMPGPGQSQHVPVMLNLSANAPAGENGAIAVTSMTVSAHPTK